MPFIFKKNNNRFNGLIVLTLVMMSLLPSLYDMSMIRCFSVLILLCQQVTQQNNLQSKTCLIIVIDVDMTSKRAYLQKVMVLLNSMTKKGGLFA